MELRLIFILSAFQFLILVALTGLWWQLSREFEETSKFLEDRTNLVVKILDDLNQLVNDVVNAQSDVAQILDDLTTVPDPFDYGQFETDSGDPFMGVPNILKENIIDQLKTDTNLSTYLKGFKTGPIPRFTHEDIKTDDELAAAIYCNMVKNSREKDKKLLEFLKSE